MIKSAIFYAFRKGLTLEGTGQSVGRLLMSGMGGGLR